MQHQTQIQVAQSKNYVELFEETISLISKYKIFWFFGLLAAISSSSLSGRSLVNLIPITMWNDFSYKHLSSLILLDIPSDRWAIWFAWTGLPSFFITGFAIILWLMHLSAQGGLIRVTLHAKAGQLISARRILKLCLSTGWRLVLLNLILYGIFYVTIWLGTFWFDPSLYSTPETEWQFIQKYEGWPHNVLGSVFWLLIPLNIGANVIYPFAKRSIILSKSALFPGLRYTISLLYHNFFQVVGLFFLLSILSYAVVGLTVVVRWNHDLLVSLSSIQDFLNHPATLVVLQILTLLVQGAFAVTVSVFGTLVYLGYEYRYQLRDKATI